jgi:uncharacterized surface protein with fasciclin (FAS1) repeats
MFKKLSLVVMLVAVMALGFASFASAAPAAAPMGDTIVDIASGNPNFSTLVAAVDKAGLVETLDGKGQFTVFAPTNAAFDNLAGALGFASGMALVDALPAEFLRAVVLYHAAPGERFSGDVVSSERIRTLSKGFLFPYVMNDMAYLQNPNGVADAQIIAVDIDASNGVIHVIDQVLVPVE